MNVGIITALLRLKDENFRKGLKDAGDRVKKLGEKYKKLGQTMTKRVTAPLAAMAALSLKAASDFESSFAGVRKTVNATEEQFAELSSEFRTMSKEIPVSVNELHAIGEAAGQLGIETENIVSFTRTMADLGVTTNLSSDEAATALARLANITGMQQENFDRLGSSVVALGNSMATTEAEIVQMSLRLAGIGSQVGLNEAQITGLAAAMSSLGIEAEAGGTAMTMVLTEINTAVISGGKELDKFAAVSRVSAKEFSRAWKADPTLALTMVLDGLEKLRVEEKDTALAMKDLGLEGIRVQDAMRRMASDTSLLTDALKISVEAWEANTALAKEAAMRYDTFASSMTVLWNHVKDVAVVLGSTLLPVMKDFITAAQPALEWVIKAAEWFANLPAPVRNTALVIGVLVAAIGPLIAILVALAPGIAVIGTALGVTAGGLAAVAGTAATAIAGLTAGLAAGYVVIKGGKAVLGWLGQKFGFVAEQADELALSVDDCAEATRAMTEAGKQFVPVTQSVTRKVKQTMDQFIAETEAINGTKQAVEDLVAAYVPLNRAQLNAALTARSIAEEQKRLDAEMDNIIASTLEWEGILPTVTGEQLLAAAATEEVKDAVVSLTDETKATTNAWAELGDILATGVGWFDQITKGILGLVDSLLNKNGGLSGALTGIGGIVSGLFGSGLGGGSNVGQMAGGILSKLGSSGILSGLFGGAAAAGGGATLASFAGGGGILGLAGSGAAAGAAAGMGPIMAAITGPYGVAAMALISMLGPQIKDQLKRLGGWVSSLFGVDQAELDARKIKGSITDLINNVMDAQQKAEAGNEQWRKSNVVVRDAYLTIGASIQEAEAQQALLASASKKSPAEAQRIVDSIKAVIEQVQAQMAETGLSMTELRNKNINAAKASAEAAAKAMTDTAVATKSAAAAASGATKKAMTDTVAVAQVASKKVSDAFTNSMTAVKNVASDTAAKVTEKFQGIDVSSPIDRFTDRLSETLGGGGEGGMAVAGAGGGGVVFQDQNAARLEALMERLPTIMERAVQHGLQTSGRKARN